MLPCYENGNHCTIYGGLHLCIVQYKGFYPELKIYLERQKFLKRNAIEVESIYYVPLLPSS
jgi:hypothetical protein